MLWTTKIGGPSHGHDYGGQALLPLLANLRTTPIIVDDPRYSANGAARSYLRLLPRDQGGFSLYLEPTQRDFPHRDRFGGYRRGRKCRHGNSRTRRRQGQSDESAAESQPVASRIGWRRRAFEPRALASATFSSRAAASSRLPTRSRSKHDWPNTRREVTDELYRAVLLPAPESLTAKRPAPTQNVADTLMRDVTTLAKDYPNRIYGTAKAAQARAYVIHQMEEIGLRPGLKDGFLQYFGSGRAGDKSSANVVGFVEGSDPKLKSEAVLVTSHLDSHPNTREGANDNATAVASMLRIAEEMKKHPPRRSVYFVAFDGEEAGRKGSRAYVENPVVPLEKTALLVNADMIGQVHLESGRRDQLYYWASGDDFAPKLMRQLGPKAHGKLVEGYPEQPKAAQWFTTDAEFLFRRGVPTINLLSGRESINHSPADTVERLIPERLRRYSDPGARGGPGGRRLAPVARRDGTASGRRETQLPVLNHARMAATAISRPELERLSAIERRLPELPRRVGETSAQG